MKKILIKKILMKKIVRKKDKKYFKLTVCIYQNNGDIVSFDTLVSEFACNAPKISPESASLWFHLDKIEVPFTNMMCVLS